MSIAELERELYPSALGLERIDRTEAPVDLFGWVVPVLHRLAALAVLVAILPMLVVIAVLIRLDSAGPVLFRQVRVGRKGQEFVVFKFRTMRADAEQLLDQVRHLNECDGLLFKIRHDPRVSAVGRWLRRYSLDELPQLWNVVRGDMALVGPRPALPHEVAEYDAWTRQRLDVKPGLTGIWQVSGRSDLPWAEGIRLDITYVEQHSPLLDLRIIGRTLAAVVKGRGAY